MGWFLSSKSESTKKKTLKKPPEPEAIRARRAAQMRVLGTVAAAVAIIGLWLGGEQWLKGEIAKTRSAPEEIVLHDLPAWMPESLAAQLRSHVASVLKPDPFNQKALDDAAMRLAASPWIAQLTRVIRRPGGRVDVYAQYREPAAVVERGSTYHLIDGQGVRLPMDYDGKTAARMPLFVIRGAAQRPPQAGQIWPGRDVSAGLKLAQIIGTRPWSSQVKVIDVTNHAGRRWRHRPHLVLHTRRGAVRWGRAPGDEGVYEPAAQTKLDHLERMQSKFGTIDDGGQIIDVTGDTVWKQEPLPSDDAAPSRYTLGR